MRALISEWPTFHISTLAAGRRELVVHRLAALHLADERRARHLGEDGLAEQDHQLVAPQDAAGGVDGAEAIGVAVERDAELGALASRRVAIRSRDVLGLRRIGVVVREAAVELAVQRHDVEAEAAVQRDRGRPAGAVAGVDDDLEAARAEPQLRGRVVEVRADDVARVHRAASGAAPASRAARRRDRAALRSSAPCSVSVPRMILKPLSSGGLWLPVIITAAAGFEVMRGEVEDRRRHDADVDDVGVHADAVGERGEQARRVQRGSRGRRRRSRPRRRARRSPSRARARWRRRGRGRRRRGCRTRERCAGSCALRGIATRPRAARASTTLRTSCARSLRDDEDRVAGFTTTRSATPTTAISVPSSDTMMLRAAVDRDRVRRRRSCCRARRRARSAASAAHEPTSFQPKSTGARQHRRGRLLHHAVVDRDRRQRREQLGDPRRLGRDRARGGGGRRQVRVELGEEAARAARQNMPAFHR